MNPSIIIYYSACIYDAVRFNTSLADYFLHISSSVQQEEKIAGSSESQSKVQLNLGYLLTVPTRVLPLLQAINRLIDLVWIHFQLIQSEIDGDDRLWTGNASPVARLFQNKVMFLLKIMLIYDEPLLSLQPPLLLKAKLYFFSSCWCQQ